MTSVRVLCFPAVLFVALSAVPLSSAEATKSLWGKKLKFKGLPCLWGLRPEAAVPALEELSACLRVQQLVPTKWTGFVYKAPGEKEIELGLGGSGEHLTVWLFGEELSFPLRAALTDWHHFCITWSGRAQRLRIYVDGNALGEARAPPLPSRRLAQNGTLSLGVSHFSVDGGLERESATDLVGEIGLFKVWSREHGGEELKRLSCADGDVVSWTRDLQQRRYDCPPEPDGSLRCAWSDYKIQMQMSVVQSSYSPNGPGALEKVTDVWLKLLFPDNIYIRNISVSSPSHSCHMVDRSALEPEQQLQGLEEHSNSSCGKCFGCEVLVSVRPAADVDVVQVHITTLLAFASKSLRLAADPDSVSVLPVGWPMTELPPTVSTAASGPSEGGPPRPNGTSTTAEPSDFNELSDSFFRVNLWVNVTNRPTKPEELIERWITNQLEQHHPLTVHNPIINEIPGAFQCTFHVQAYNSISADQAQHLIQTSLMSNYQNGSIIITPLGVESLRIFPGNCAEEQTNSTFYGQYIWPETFPLVEAEMICLKPRTERAYRLCQLDFESDVSVWAEPDLTSCEPVVTISDLDNVTVTPGNAGEVVDVIRELVGAELGSGGELSPSALDSVAGKLRQVVEVGVIGPDVGVDIVNIVADVLESNTNVTPVANIVLGVTERTGDKMVIHNESLSVAAPAVALSVINAERERFSGLTFGVSSLSSTLIPEVLLDQSFVGGAPPGTLASVSLPPALGGSFQPGENATTRVHFQFYATDELFQVPSGGAPGASRLVSFIVSASINNSHVVGLPPERRVVVTLGHRPPQQPEDKVKCVFWDFQMNDGRSGWNQSGCETSIISPSQTSCLCDHLTHFALLLDVSRTPVSEADMQILTFISFLGCGISCVFLGITLLNYLYFKKLRSDYPSKILINLSAALLGLGLVFLTNSWLSSFASYGLCIAAGATLHYFLLASFAWMGLEAVHMYLALVKVFNTYIPSYILKFCAVGWGVPLLIVGLVLAVDRDAYGAIAPGDSPMTLQNTDPFCWLQDSTCFYVTVVAFIIAILLGNMFVFVVVLIQIRRTRANKPADDSCGDLRAVASLTILLGLTWSMGLFSFGPGRVVMMYLFVFFNSFQGFFVFLFHCLMKENMRKQWRSELHCGTFRFRNIFSGRSGSQTEDGRTKNDHLTNSDSLVCDSGTTLGSSDMSSSGKHCHQGA